MPLAISLDLVVRPHQVPNLNINVVTAPLPKANSTSNATASAGPHVLTTPSKLLGSIRPTDRSRHGRSYGYHSSASCGHSLMLAGRSITSQREGGNGRKEAAWRRNSGGESREGWRREGLIYREPWM